MVLAAQRTVYVIVHTLLRCRGGYGRIVCCCDLSERLKWTEQRLPMLKRLFSVEHDRNGVELLVCFATEGEGSPMKQRARLRCELAVLSKTWKVLQSHM